MTTSDDQTPGELPDYGSVPRPPGDSYAAPPPPPPGDGTIPPSPLAPRRPINQKALWSMIIGVASLIGVCCVFGGFVGIAAIVLGVLGRAEVLRSNGEQTGVGFAIAGVVTGAVAEFGSIVMLLLFSFGGV
jgi:hypothetical protein